MISRRIIEQLDSLKAIKPRSEWKERTRDILLAQISAQGNGNGAHTSAIGSTSAYLRGALIFGYRQTFEQLFARPLVLSGSLSVFVIMVVSAVVAAQGSIPGDPLYTVKRTEEQVRSAFVSPADSPALQMDFANKRIQELSRISGKSLSIEQKNKQKTLLAKEANASISMAREDLLRLAKETPERAVRVATVLKNNAQKSAEQAKNAFSEDSNEQLQLSEVIDILDETKGAALTIIVEKKDSAKISDSEVTGHLDGAIGELEERLARLQSVHAAGFKTEEEKQSTEAKGALKSARQAMERKDFTAALADIGRSRKIIATGEKQETGGDAIREEEGGLQ